MKKLFLSILIVVMSFSGSAFAADNANHILTVTLSEIMTLQLGGAAPTITIAAMDDNWVADATPPTIGVEHNRAANQKVTLQTSVFGGTWTAMDARVTAPIAAFGGVGTTLALVTNGAQQNGGAAADFITGIAAGEYLGTANPVEDLTYEARARAGAVTGADKVITITYTLTN